MKPQFFNASVLQNVDMHTNLKEEADQKSRPSKITQSQFQELLDIKKERARRERASVPLYRNIGYTISLLLVLIVFNWNFPVDKIDILAGMDVTPDEIYDIPISTQPPPPPPKSVEVFKVVEVDDAEVLEDIEVKLDLEVNEETKVQEVIITAVEEEEEVVDEIFSVVEVQPMPVGGNQAFHQYLAENIKYPKSAERLGVMGKVFVQFVVEKDGSLTDIRVVKGIGAGCDEEAVRVLEAAPKWTPGRQRGQAVRVNKIVPIVFKLVKH